MNSNVRYPDGDGRVLPVKQQILITRSVIDNEIDEYMGRTCDELDDGDAAAASFSLMVVAQDALEQARCLRESVDLEAKTAED